MINALIKLNIDTHTPDSLDKPPLYYLVTSAYFKESPQEMTSIAVALMQASGVMKDDTDTEAELTVLMHLIHEDKHDELTLLLKNGANPNKSSKTGQTPLLFAISERKEDCVRALCRFNAAPNKFDQIKTTQAPLLLAAWNGDVRLVELLLSESKIHARVDIYDNKKETTALMIAAFFGHYDVAKLLIEHKANIDHYNLELQNPLIMALKKFTPKKIEIIILLLEAGATTNTVSIQSITPLKLALKIESIPDRENVLRLLIQYGLDINIQDRNDQTALGKYVYECSHEHVRLLLRHHATPDIDTINEQSLPAFCVSKTLEKAIQEQGVVHLEGGAVLYRQKEYSSRAFREMTMLLATHSEYPDEAIQLAIEGNDSEFITYFIQSVPSTDPDTMTADKSQTLLTWAIQHYAKDTSDPSRFSLIRQLMVLGANANLAVTADHITPLMIASSMNLVDVVELLCQMRDQELGANKSQADVTQLDSQGNHALLHLCMDTTREQQINRSVTTLIMLGTDARHVNANDETALFHAVFKRNLGAVQAILSTDKPTYQQLMTDITRHNKAKMNILFMINDPEYREQEPAICQFIIKQLFQLEPSRVHILSIESGSLQVSETLHEVSLGVAQTQAELERNTMALATLEATMKREREVLQGEEQEQLKSMHKELAQLKESETTQGLAQISKQADGLEASLSSTSSQSTLSESQAPLPFEYDEEDDIIEEPEEAATETVSLIAASLPAQQALTDETKVTDTTPSIAITETMAEVLIHLENEEQLMIKEIELKQQQSVLRSEMMTLNEKLDQQNTSESDRQELLKRTLLHERIRETLGAIRNKLRELKTKKPHQMERFASPATIKDAQTQAVTTSEQTSQYLPEVSIADITIAPTPMQEKITADTPASEPSQHTGTMVQELRASLAFSIATEETDITEMDQQALATVTATKSDQQLLDKEKRLQQEVNELQTRLNKMIEQSASDADSSQQIINFTMQCHDLQIELKNTRQELQSLQSQQPVQREKAETVTSETATERQVKTEEKGIQKVEHQDFSHIQSRSLVQEMTEEEKREDEELERILQQSAAALQQHEIFKRQIAMEIEQEIIERGTYAPQKKQSIDEKSVFAKAVTTDTQSVLHDVDTDKAITHKETTIPKTQLGHTGDPVITHTPEDISRTEMSPESESDICGSQSASNTGLPQSPDTDSGSSEQSPKLQPRLPGALKKSSSFTTIHSDPETSTKSTPQLTSDEQIKKTAHKSLDMKAAFEEGSKYTGHDAPETKEFYFGMHPFDTWKVSDQPHSPQSESAIGEVQADYSVHSSKVRLLGVPKEPQDDSVPATGSTPAQSEAENIAAAAAPLERTGFRRTKKTFEHTASTPPPLSPEGSDDEVSDILEPYPPLWRRTGEGIRLFPFHIATPPLQTSSPASSDEEGDDSTFPYSPPQSGEPKALGVIEESEESKREKEQQI